MACSDLCTAAKCEELEERIGRLEQALDLLQASFNAHISEAIPEAHDYQEPDVTVSLAVGGNTLKVFVKVGNKSDDEIIELPKSNLAGSAFIEGQTLTISIADGQSETVFSTNLPKDAPDVDVEITQNQGGATIKVSVNEISDQDVISFSEVIEQIESSKSNLAGTAFVEGQTLFISIADGESETVFSVDLPIPEISDFEPIVNVSTNYISSQTIATTVSVNGVTAQDTFSLLDTPKSNLAGTAFVEGQTLFISIADGESQTVFSVDLPIVETEEHLKSNLVGTAFVEGQTLTISIADGESQTVFSVDLPLGELPEIPKSNLVGTAFIEGQILTISIADGESQTVFSVDLPIPELEPPFVTVDVFPIDDNNFTIKVGVDGVFDDDILTTNIMDCSDLEELIRQLSITINNEFNNLDNEINNLENAIKVDINEVKDVVTVDISGTANSSYECGFALDESDNPIPGYAQSLQQSKAYSGVGLQGIHENLKVINSNLDALHSDICKAIDPISSITIDDLYKFCDNSNIQRGDYPEGIGGDTQYNNAILQYFTDLFAETKYAYLLNNVTGDKLVTAPNNWITNYLADFSLIQAKINNTEICNLEIPEATDVVSLVASPKYQTNIEGKVLVLHFVTFDNYPKRLTNSTYWPVQIPAAKETYVWENDFKDLTWSRGNQYAELKLIDYRSKVSGWFANKGAADVYFDAVLGLTSAIEENRIYPEHKTPKTNIVSRVTRPYRAFIESVNEFGQAICHIKYVPPIENPNE
jgi:predicted ATP-grasp superfamily ATP-dependent carboligase